MDIIKSFKVFQLVIEQESFSRAADQLNLVPSAVSRQISELENWLGIRLINRTTRSLHLTGEGSEYLAKMSSILGLVDELKCTRGDLAQLTGKLTLSAPMMLGQFILPNAISAFKNEHANVQVSLSLLNRKVDLVEEGYDLALRVGNLADSNLIARKLGTMSFVTVASPEYLRKHGTPLVPRELHLHNCLINTALSSSGRWEYTVEGNAKKVKVNGDIESNESLALLSLAKAGQGIVFLPELYVQKDLARGALVEILRDYRPAPLPINLLYTSNRLISPLLKTFIDFIIEHFAEINLQPEWIQAKL